jgi:TPR repeat protein
MVSRLVICVLLTTPLGASTGPLQDASVVSNSSVKVSPRDIEELQKKADAGDANAQYTLGRAYESGHGLPQRADQATIWYRKAAEQGNEKAENSLGVLYWFGNGVEKDKAESIRWYRRAARQGNATAMFNLGAAYYNGEGVSINDTQAYAWFLLSSEAGNASGQEAAKRSEGEHGPNGVNEACVAVGRMYEKGQDLPKSLESAARWYRKAAERGYPEGAISLAALYLNASDYGQARPWCEAAAKEKLSGGYYCLGYLYQHGSGVNPDPKKASQWYEQGAETGNTASMLALAKIYENGEGTKVDRDRALLWYLSAARRDQSAINEAKRLRASMTEKEWKASLKKLPRGFDPKVVDTILSGKDAPPAPHPAP